MLTGKIHFLTASVFLLVMILSCGITKSESAENVGTKCRMEFNLHGWSIFYETAKGTGVIKCSNGQTSHVVLRVKGGGLTAGKYKLTGKGEFSEVSGIKELYGAYAAAEVHAGVVKSADAQVVTKGDISLAISAKGRGFDLGVGFSGFKILPAGKRR